MFGTYENYAYYRDAQYLTDYRVAKLCNLNRSTISDWKHGKHQPQNKTLKKIADLLGVSVGDFYKDPKENKKPSIAFNSSPALESIISYDGEEIEPLPVQKYTVVLSDNRQVTLTRTEYNRLKKSIDAFIDSWINVNIGV